MRIHNATRSALHALRDCGVIRVRGAAPGYVKLWCYGDADRTPVPGQPGMFDYRLSASGKLLAHKELSSC